MYQHTFQLNGCQQLTINLSKTKICMQYAENHVCYRVFFSQVATSSPWRRRAGAERGIATPQALMRKEINPTSFFSDLKWKPKIGW